MRVVGAECGVDRDEIDEAARAELSLDTASVQNIVITGQLANTGETITRESYTVELICGA